MPVYKYAIKCGGRIVTTVSVDATSEARALLEAEEHTRQWIRDNVKQGGAACYPELISPERR